MRARVAIWLFFAACLLTADAAERKPEDSFARVDLMGSELNGSCKYSIVEKNKQNKELMCVLQLLRSRCNKIDDCYVYCIGNDVGVGIGGGCAHLCNYALRAKWDPPKGMDACTSK